MEKIHNRIENIRVRTGKEIIEEYWEQRKEDMSIDIAFMCKQGLGYRRANNAVVDAYNMKEK